MKVVIFIIMLLALNSGIYSQDIRGTVKGKSGSGTETLTGATIRALGSKNGAVSDENGNFNLKLNPSESKIILVSYFGFKTDTTDITGREYVEIILENDFSTSEIKVSDSKHTFIENVGAKTEILTGTEFRKAACCDLTGCFGNNSSIDIAVTDIITDSRELKVLGLEGKYTQILIDNQPIVTGVKTKYELSSISGTLINSIKISKGTNSVIQGYESIGGLVNVLLMDYENSDNVLINGFVNHGMEKQFNANYAGSLNSLNSFFSFHTVQKSNRIDKNGDGFLDNPLTTRYMLFNKFDIGENNGKDKYFGNIGIRYWNEERIGGQLDFEKNNEGSDKIYGQTVKINSGEIYSRSILKLSEHNELKFLINGSLYSAKSYYGITKYDAYQQNFYLNAIYDMEFSHDLNLKIGAGYKFQNTEEEIAFTGQTQKTYAGSYGKQESIPGIFTELSIITLNEKLNIIPGIRADFHNEHGTVLTPRLLLKYMPFPATTLRLTAGTGFRTVYVFNEYSNALASSRNIIFPGNNSLEPEKVINYGIDLLQLYDFGDITGNINIDYFRTNFTNKVTADYDSDPNLLIFSNLNSNSYSDAFQAELNINIKKIIDLKLSYKYLYSEYELNGIEYEEPFESKNKILGSVTFTAPEELFIFNTNIQWYGKQRLPSTQKNPLEFKRPVESDSYFIINAQLTKKIGMLELYVGAENLLDYVQPNPIIDPQNPFGKYFDTSFIWGPVKGREFYAGFRFYVK